MPWPKGKPRDPNRCGAAGKGKGKPKGTKNKTTVAIKEAFLAVFEKRGGSRALLDWSNKEPTEFYRIMAKLLPRELEVSGEINHLHRLPPVLEEKLIAVYGAPERA